jgi:hypothetical protein
MRSRRDAHKGRVSDNKQTKHSARHKRMESEVWKKKKKRKLDFGQVGFGFSIFHFPSL